MAAIQFPRQDISISERTPAWFSKHLDYAESLLRNFSTNRLRMTRLYESYNGVKTPGSLAYLERRYGKQNAAKYIAYRVGRTKIQLLHGEWLKRPISSTVETINSEALSEKMKNQDIMIGAMLAKKELEDLKNIVGVDVMEGAPIPENEDDPIWEKMSFKDKDEDTMQLILDEQMAELDLKKKFADCFLDLLITSMCYCKIETNREGDIEFHRIDPRDAIYEEIQGDDFLQKSPIRGCRQLVSVHEILMRYDLTKEQRDMLNTARQNPNTYIGSNGISRGYMKLENGQLLCSIVHIEWDGVVPMYYKLSPKTKTQSGIDDTQDYFALEMDARYYEDNKEMHDKNVEKGDYKVETRYRHVVYESTRIGGCIDVNRREKLFQPRSVDDPTYVLNASYHGFICGTTDGTRISLQQMIENFDNLYDICMYQINKDLARAKGKALFYDRAGLPEGKKMKDVLFQILNDGLIDYNSAAAGNFSGKNLDLTNAVKEIDLGLSQSLEYLFAMQTNIVNQLNQITGINENREGIIAASSTATNAQSAIQASRTITEPLFSGMNDFVQLVMQSIANQSAISWAFYKLDKGEQILGTQKFRFLQVTKSVGYKNYGVHVEDGSRYLDIRRDIRTAAEISLNAKEIRPKDYLRVLMSETTAQMKNALDASWAEMQDAMAKSDAANNQAQQQMQQAQLQQQLQITTEDREDRQNATKEEIVLQGQVQMQVDDNEAKNKIVENQHGFENNLLGE